MKTTIPVLLAILLAAIMTNVGEPAPHRPNVVFVLADDLGWKDLGCYGSTFHETPNLDRLAAGGMRFTNAYAACCACSPTRASIMAGCYPATLNLTTIVGAWRGNKAPEDSRVLPPVTLPHLPLERTTLAELLKEAGYATGMVGKWHVGQNEFGPLGQGFDVAIAPPHRGMPKSYFWPEWDGNPNMPGRFEGDYLTDLLTEKGCEFVDRNHRRPFFLYMCYHSVHVPIESKADKVAHFEDKLRRRAPGPGEQNNAHYAAMVQSVDDGVGRIIDALRKHHLEKNTIFIFFSDNGGLAHPSHVGDHTPATTNAPLRSGKGYLYEGGIREPCIISWPGSIAPSGVCPEPISSIDFLPTVCELVGVDTASGESIDGISFARLLSDPKTSLSREALFWHYPHFSSMGGRPSGAVRAGRWKLLEHYETGRLELFDLKADIGERTNLASARPDKTSQLHELLKTWRAQRNAGMPTRPNPAYKGE